MLNCHMKLHLLAWVALLLQLAAPAQAAAAGNVEAGKALAEQWCQSCHVIEPGGTMASDSAPPFPQVAADPATTEEGLRGWLFNPHPPMPNLELSQRQIDDLTAYILSLKPQ